MIDLFHIRKKKLKFKIGKNFLRKIPLYNLNLANCNIKITGTSEFSDIKPIS